MPLFRKESRSASNSNILNSTPNSNVNSNSSSNSNSTTSTPTNSPLIKPVTSHSVQLHNKIQPLSSASSAVSNSSSAHHHSFSSVSMNNMADSDSSFRSHRSNSVSQKFKNLFTGGDHHNNSGSNNNLNNSESVKRVNSTSSLLKKNIYKNTGSSESSTSINKSKEKLRLQTDLSSLSASPCSKPTLKSPLPHPQALPIPDRSLGRQTTQNNHSIHITPLANSGSAQNIATTRSKSQQTQQSQQTPTTPNDLNCALNKLSITPEVTNDIDSQLDTPIDQVLKKVDSEFKTSDKSQSAHLYQSNNRLRSSTVSAAFYHNQSSNPTSRENISSVPEPNSSTLRLPSSNSQYSLSSALHGPTNLRSTLRHTETVNYGSTHLKHQREQVIKLAGGRITLYEYGRNHEHDYSKYKTHPNKPGVGLFNWMKKKDSTKSEQEEPYEIIEKSISLLPDKYSGDLMRVKNNPKNYIWNYDDDDEDDDDNDEGDNYDESESDSASNSENQEEGTRRKSKVRPPMNRKSSLHSTTSSKTVRSRQSQLFNKHYNSDDEYEDENEFVKDIDPRNSNDVSETNITSPNRSRFNQDSDEDSETDSTGDDDEDDEDDDDFNDEIDNMMIEPIIGKEQVFSINSMLNKIEHPDKFKARIKEKERSGKVKLTLAQKYGHIEGIVGKGSYGTVCISSKTVGNTKIYFAIKQLKRKKGESLHHFGNRVTSEFMISSSLTHQAVINVYDLMVDPVSMTYSEIMEFIPCGDLFSLISATNGLHIVECDCFFKQILNAITYLHSVGISHNDLKVENLLLTRKGQLKIIDFGTSAVFRTAWESDVQFSRGACGSERYVAPEQYIKDREYDPRLGDVWSLGIIYLTMYYGKYAWEVARISDETYARFLDSRAIYDYQSKSASKAHQFLCVRSGSYSPIEGIKGGILNSWIQKGGELDSNIRTNEEELINDSRRYVLYNILNPDPTFRMRTYQIWQSEWIKNFRVCDAGRGYVSYDNYIEMALRSAQDVENKEKERIKERDDQLLREKSLKRGGVEMDKEISVSGSSKLERKESKKGHGFLGFGSKA